MHKSCVFASIEPRVNKPPVAVVSPKYQEISLPTSSTVIDGSRTYQIFFTFTEPDFTVAIIAFYTTFQKLVFNVFSAVAKNV